MNVKLLAVALAMAGTALAAPTKITFWHSMESSKDDVKALADAFNRSQDDYEIVPQVAGNYREAETKLISALRANSGPVMFQAELSFFTKLAADGVLADLSSLEKTLPEATVKDFYPAVWEYGEVGGRRYGLPWNTSTPVLYYNANVFKAKGVKPPKTYAEFEAAAKKVSNRGSKGFIAMADSWQFEQMVLARGGNVVKGNQPNFDSPEVVDALEMLVRMSKNGSANPRNLGEAQFAILDFVRTKNFMAVASIANWPDILPYSVAFELGVAPMPCAKTCQVPFGGAELVVLKNASAKEQAGAFAFWKFLVEPKNLADWVQKTYYVSPRRSVLPLLKDFYAQNPYRKTAFEQLDQAVSRPRVPGYATWRAYLEEAIERATKGGVPARAALQEAQRRALAAR
ncbi:sn-glycerol 3-phosphate transport system substrate-binding protein [Deinobacterium chartae]|uniref:sn-glycerol 3-phosphate transport system substrate-binding protein n=1 Tax=Deinobacterium chartae TaxID=521158 RepID=A0A841I3Z5_9DEIO|nr:ABC transporter substrate-binding protein [Deinobacterium chartae]MBB6099108.1 sn-glycerol 3-phosphate transport system substrate-binding protein [Deinobacterium chartae]